VLVLLCCANTLARDPDCEDCKELYERGAVGQGACVSLCKRIWEGRACDYVCRMLRRGREAPGHEGPCKKMGYCKEDDGLSYRGGGAKQNLADTKALFAKLDAVINRLDTITKKISTIEGKMSSQQYTRSDLEDDYASYDRKYHKTAEDIEAEEIRKEIEEMTRTAKLLEQEQREMKAKQNELAKLNREYAKARANLPSVKKHGQTFEEIYDTDCTYWFSIFAAFLWSVSCFLMNGVVDDIPFKPYFLQHMNLSFMILRGYDVMKPLIIVFMAWRLILQLDGISTIFSFGGDVAVLTHRGFNQAACWSSVSLLVGLEMGTMALFCYQNYCDIKKTKTLSQRTLILKYAQVIPPIVFMIGVFILRPMFHHMLILIIFHMELPRLIEGIWQLLNLSEKLHWRSDIVRAVLQGISALWIMNVYNLIKYDAGIWSPVPIFIGFSRLFVQIIESGGLIKFIGSAITAIPLSPRPPRRSTRQQ